ncbi:MAG: GIY-YIG nuclease family protein [Mesorhizobium sp.]|uniref:GIY-YIG nuclease family protein n=1 Tax=Mesorhizobium sp. TaxID=1871066 RepID=UPI000FE584EB|nr:GIY-YIG nuclease family protein [Mesorhizobium sp.]RWB91328.1 MAG: GIY-YIG nuclease family protein [Mesorhizobium sp.]
MNARPQGRSLELYFIDGRPDGMLTAEVFNWTGHILMAPRTQISVALARTEARYAGAYLLIGERDGQPLAYIGEGDEINHRIKSHDINKDWWTVVVLITTTANNLHKAHVQYLEARLIEVARSIGRVALDNATTPARPTLSEAAQSNMETFLDYLFLVLPALRIDMFLAGTRPEQPNIEAGAPTAAPIFELASREHGLMATARLEGGDFIVEAGSLARANWSGRGSENSSYAHLHAELLRTGVLVPHGDMASFSEAYAFNSTSAAAAVVRGRPANGTLEWKVKGTGQSYKAWEAEQLGGAL